MSPHLAAVAVGGLPILGELVALFTAVVALTWLCHRLRIVPIVGFLAAGVAVGPHAAGLVTDIELISAAAEVGVILLLFTIGVEFHLEKLARIRRVIVVGGGLQVTLTVAAVAGGLVLLGVAPAAGVYTGFLVALSSTVIVLKLLDDRGRTDGPSGRITLGTLIFQDLAVVLMVLLVPVLAGGAASAAELGWVLARAAVMVGLVLTLARKIVPALLDRIAETRDDELFLLAVVVICLGTAWLAELAGISLALGAFLAGLVVSESRFREHAVGEILPLRTVFNAVFFVSVGMLLDLRIFLEHPGAVAGSAAAILLLKTAVTTAAVRLLGYPLRLALPVGLMLAQVGEFSLVLARIGGRAGLAPAGAGAAGEQVFLAVAVLLMAATPFLMRAGFRLLEPRGADGAPAAGEEPAGPSDHVIVGGFGRTGRWLARALERLRVPYRIVDLNPVSVEEARARGVPITFGDLARPRTLREAGLARARLLVLALNDPDSTEAAVRMARRERPDLPILVRSRYLVEAEALREAGASEVVGEEVEAASRLVERALRLTGAPEEEARLQVERLRTDDGVGGG